MIGLDLDDLDLHCARAQWLPIHTLPNHEDGAEVPTATNGPACQQDANMSNARYRMGMDTWMREIDCCSNFQVELSVAHSGT